MDKKKDIDSDDVGSIRWADNFESTPSTQEKHQSKVRLYGEVRLNTSPPNLGNSGRHEQGSFSMDVEAFEKSLKEKREQQLREQSPRIEIRLRETASNSPRFYSSSQAKINIHHIERGLDECAEVATKPKSSNVDEVDYAYEAPRKIQRTITYEKVLKTKSIRETVFPKKVHINENIQPPTVHRTLDCLIDKSSPTEQTTVTEDSAYSSHLRVSSCGTPTTISISSSSNSLHQGFTSDDNVYTQETPSCETICVESVSTKQPRRSINSSKIVYVDSTATIQQSPVTGSNENVHWHFDSPRTSSEIEDISRDWYNEYKTQTVLVDCPSKMDFKRSNSQYDNHIRQIRGIYNTYQNFR